MKVVFCTPSLGGPHPEYIKALEASIPLIKAAGWEEAYVQEIGNAYISGARAGMARKALDNGADVIVFLDYDLSWEPENLLRLISTEGDVVAGTYRFKTENIEYMGSICTRPDGKPLLRDDGCCLAQTAPAGFLKVTKNAIDKFMKGYPELCYGPRYNPSIDLFNHGAHDNAWWGEDYAFCRRWRAIGGEVVVIQTLKITHWKGEQAFPGCLHEYLLAPQPEEINA